MRGRNHSLELNITIVEQFRELLGYRKIYDTCILSEQLINVGLVLQIGGYLNRNQYNLADASNVLNSCFIVA